MAGRQPTLINRQFNSPIKLYSPENVADALSKHAQLLSNGTVGVDFHQLAAPNLANSAVLRMVEEEERQRGGKGRCRRFDWPPKRWNNEVDGKSDQGFFSSLFTSITPGYKRVAWPPPLENEQGTKELPVYSKGPEYINNFSPEPYNQHQSTYNTPGSASLQAHPGQVSGYQSQPPVQTQLYQPSQKAFQPVYFEPPPTTILLRSEPPISQEPPPVFSSQPAATKAIGPRMRGDEKWPPATYKAQAVAENQARVALAKGPAVRPRKVQKDYSSFFAQNALNSNYPAYRAPPGTQHYIEEGTSNL